MNFSHALRLLTTALIIIVLSKLAFGDRYFVTQKNRLVPLAGAKGHHPAVEARGKLKPIENGSIVTKPGATPEASAAIVALEKVKVVSRNDPSSKLFISFEAKADQDLESAYFVARSYEAIDSNIRAVVSEMPRLRANVPQSIELEIPMGFNWDVRPVSLSIFTGTKKISIEHGPTLKGRKMHGDAYSEAGVARVDLRPYSRYPRALFQVEAKDPPKGLLDEADEAYVIVEFYIEKNGSVIEATSEDFSHEGLIDLAIESVKASKFSPAYKEGEPFRVKTRQKFWFKRPVK